MTVSSRALRSIWLALLLPFAGCSEDDPATARVAQLSHGCLVNSDCAAPLVCAFQRCHVECVTTRDCDGTLRCVGAHEPSRVCQLEEETTCKTSADCAPGLLCAGDGACRDHCAADSECIGDQVCTRGVCAEPAELDESGELPQTSPQSTCRLNSDCAESDQCVGGACVAQCRETRDCAADQVCVEGACRSTEVGCEGPECACACRADIDCSEGETCDGCACQPGPAPLCESSLDCAADKQCVDGDCRCRCVEDRDCPSGTTCDGCACHIPESPLRVLHDATVQDAADALLMRDVKEVETRLKLSGFALRNTIGLEQLVSVGSLSIVSASNLATTESVPSPLSGLANLRTIRGDLQIVNTGLSSLPFHPELVVEGDVIVEYTSVPCEVVEALRQNLLSTGFQGNFRSNYNGNSVCPQ